jgi:hypothetical protein
VQDNLTPELDRVVGEKFASACESALDWLRREAALGFAQLDAGGTVDLTREEFMAQMRQRYAR